MATVLLRVIGIAVFTLMTYATTSAAQEPYRIAPPAPAYPMPQTPVPVTQNRAEAYGYAWDVNQHRIIHVDGAGKVVLSDRDVERIAEAVARKLRP